MVMGQPNYDTYGTFLNDGTGKFVTADTGVPCAIRDTDSSYGYTQVYCRSIASRFGPPSVTLGDIDGGRPSRAPTPDGCPERHSLHDS